MARRPGMILPVAAAVAGLLHAGPLAAAEAPPVPTAASPGAAEASVEGGSFVETFERLSDRRWYVSDGWANGDHQRCTWSRHRARIAKPGELALTLSDAAYKDRAFSCAEIQTRERYGYGTYEVRMRAAAAPGLLTAFFTYNGPEDGDPRTNDEIDIEILGRDTRRAQVNYFTAGVGRHESLETLDLDAAATTADYAVAWLPDRIRWYVNGRLLREVVASKDGPIPSHAGKIMLSIWSGQGEDMEAWLGRADYPGRPVTAVFDRVAFTKMGEPCAFKGSILCR